MIRSIQPPTATQLEDARRVIGDHLAPTPTVTIDVRGRPVYAKLESLQVTGSFKVRGALAAIAAAHRADPSGAVITSSAGNHGLGIAHASNLLGVRATVVVPANASAAKVRKLGRYDIELIQHGVNYDEAQAHALSLAQSRSLHYISPFNDADVIAGQATIFDEIALQAPDLAHLVVPVGGGGLISGILISRDQHDRRDIVVTGVQPQESAAMYHVLRGVAMSEVRHHPTIADGLAGGGDEGSITNAIIAEHGVDLVLVPEVEIRGAVREAAESNGLILEGSATTPYAAIATALVAAGEARVGFIASGRNIAHELLSELLAAPRRHDA